jgi:hypothetical protein
MGVITIGSIVGIVVLKRLVVTIFWLLLAIIAMLCMLKFSNKKIVPNHIYNWYLTSLIIL